MHDEMCNEPSPGGTLRCCREQHDTGGHLWDMGSLEREHYPEEDK